MWLTVQVAGQTSPFFPPPSKLREKSVISSKAPFEKPSNPVIAREKAEQPAKPNTWEGIWNIVNSGVTHSLLKPGPVWGGRGGVWAHGVKEKCFQIHKRELWQQLGIAFNTPTERAPLFLKTSLFKMNISLLAKFARAFFIPTPATPPTPQPPTVNGVYGHQWPSFMCWQDVFLSLSNQRGGIIIPGQPHVPVLLTRVYWGWKHWNAVWVQCNSAVLLVLKCPPQSNPSHLAFLTLLSSSSLKKKSLDTN